MLVIWIGIKERVRRKRMKKLLNWRVQIVGGQCFCFFDPRVEKITVESLTPAERKERIHLNDSVSASADGSGSDSLNSERLLPYGPTI